MLSYQKWGKNKTPDKLKEDHFIGKYYVMYETKKTEKLEKELKEMLIKWENKDKETIKLWKKMNKWCYKGINQTLNKFKIDKFDKIYYESNFYLDGKKEALKLKDKKIAIVDDNNALYVDLSSEKLGRLYLLRGDNTTLYSTQDLVLTKLKYSDFKFSKSIMVIANEQKHYLKQLFSVFQKAKYTFADKCHHLGFGLVRLPEGKFSSRQGNAIIIDDLIKEITKLLVKEVKKRNSKINEKTCEKIGISAIKYHLLKYNNNKDIIFNPEESLSFEGNTGPYLLYSLVRANKIIDYTKANGEGTTFAFNLLKGRLVDLFRQHKVKKSHYENKRKDFLERVHKIATPIYFGIIKSDLRGKRKKLQTFYEEIDLKIDQYYGL